MKLFIKILNWLKKNYLWIILISINFFGFFYPDDTLSPDISANSTETQVEYYDETDELAPEVQQENSKRFRGFYYLTIVVGGSITFAGLMFYLIIN